MVLYIHEINDEFLHKEIEFAKIHLWTRSKIVARIEDDQKAQRKANENIMLLQLPLQICFTKEEPIQESKPLTLSSIEL